MLALMPLWFALVGCQALEYYEPSMDRPVAPPCEPPRELSKVSLPAYRLEPPDVVQIQMLKAVPRQPYQVAVYDVLQVIVLGTLPDQPLQGYFAVDAQGLLNLGPFYGSLPVVGMTVDQIRIAIYQHLAQLPAGAPRDPQVDVQLSQIAELQLVTGTYLVGPDGTLNLLKYGKVRVSGMTTAEAERAVEMQLSAHLQDPDVALDVVAFNSKVYYIITEGAHLGDSVVRVPITGNETVLDAISQVQGISQVSSKEIWIARPAPGGFGCEQILPVDWVAVTQGGSTATNYQILPGDRVFIAEDHMVALTNWVGKVIGPFERVIGFGGLTASTIRAFNVIDSEQASGFGF
jgi:polysaccharide export outer membrane protein